MSKEDIEAQIKQWQLKIEKYNDNICGNNRRIEELEEIITKLRKQAEEMEIGLDETLKRITKKIDVLNGCEKFKTDYYEQVKGILYNSSTNSAITDMRQAISKIKNECSVLDGENDKLEGQIYYANQQITQLQEQLRMEMMKCE